MRRQITDPREYKKFMKPKYLKDALKQAREKSIALGHFNFSDLAGLRAIVRAAKEIGVPVILGTSEGEADFVGIKQAAALVRSLRVELDHPLFLNADHFRDLDKAKEAAKAGYDAVVFDVAGASLEENIAKTREAVKLLKRVDHRILVEGEIGYIGTSSEVMENLPEAVKLGRDSLPKVEEVERFVKETKVDLVAPAVGNFHGIVRGNKIQAGLQIGLIEEISSRVSIPLVLHGGSGIDDVTYQRAIAAGTRIVHVNTDLRVEWRRGLEESLAQTKEVAPYKLFIRSEEGVYQVVLKRLKLFSGVL